MKINQIGETCIYAKNLEKSVFFYRDLVGLELFSYKAEKHAFFKTGSSVLLVFNPEDSKNKTKIPPHYGSGNLHFAFECSKEDYPKWKQKIQLADIELEHEEDWGNGFLSFYFRDPDNHCVEFIMKGMWF